MAEGDKTEIGEKQNGLENGTDAAAKKAAEANGSNYMPMKDRSSVSMGDESDVSIEKPSRRRECVFIVLTIVLGLALIGVLIFFSFGTGTGKTPETVTQKAVATEIMTSPTTTTTTTEATTGPQGGFNGIDDPSSLMRNNPGALLRGLPRGPPQNNEPPGDDDDAGAWTTTTEKIDFSKIDKRTLLRTGRKK